MLITTQFSIKDLENLTGVKAHTIRIWEKRYKLLEPARTDTNIRTYDLVDLKKLLNVTFLYNEGYKISKIARFGDDEIVKLISGMAETNTIGFAMQAFKTAMFDFDHHLFSRTYNDLSAKKTFEEIFHDVLLPFLYDIGLLWQTGTIDPSHERFISELIKQKVIVNISKVQEKKTKKKAPSFVLYLPLEEIHEIGLLYANYEIISAGYHTVYLGTNIPMDSLKHILKHYDEVTFLSYFTVKPDDETMYEYANRFEKEICSIKPVRLWTMGWKVRNLDPRKLPTNVTAIPGLKDLTLKLKELNLS